MRWLFSVFIIFLFDFGYCSVCAVYFTGIGCPHCAKSDPYVLEKLPRETDFVVIEYEIYRDSENANLLSWYTKATGSRIVGVPWLIFDESTSLLGDTPIINNAEAKILFIKNNSCFLPGSKVSFKDLNISTLPLKPKIWKSNRVLIRDSKAYTSDVVLKVLLQGDMESMLYALGSCDFEPVSPYVPISHGKIEFEHAVRINGWIFEWNGRGWNGEKGKVYGDSILKLEDGIYLPLRFPELYGNVCIYYGKDAPCSECDRQVAYDVAELFNSSCVSSSDKRCENCSFKILIGGPVANPLVSAGFWEVVGNEKGAIYYQDKNTLVIAGIDRNYTKFAEIKIKKG